jgi:hypothetical protein
MERTPDQVTRNSLKLLTENNGKLHAHEANYALLKTTAFATRKPSADRRKTLVTNEQRKPQIVEFLLNLNSAKIDKLESALEKNWITHVILAGVGVALIFRIGNLPNLIVAKYFTQEQYDARAAAAIMLPIFLYYFMKLGHLLTLFNEARRLQDTLLKEYLTIQFDERQTEPLHRTTSFLAESFYPGSGGDKMFISYLFVTSVVLSTAQGAALFLIVQAYHLNRWSIAGLTLSGIVLLILYFLFWRSQKDRFRATLAVLFSIVLTTAWLIVFSVFAKSS